VGPGQDVEFRLESDGSCPEEVTWDFGDGETDSSSIPTHSYDQPGNYGARATAECGCSGEISSDPILVTVVPMNVEVHTRYIDGRDELDLQVEDDEVKDKAPFHWILGGTRVRLEADPLAIIAARAYGIQVGVRRWQLVRKLRDERSRVDGRRARRA
jgi:hypothetical protein